MFPPIWWFGERNNSGMSSWIISLQTDNGINPKRMLFDLLSLVINCYILLLEVFYCLWVFGIRDRVRNTSSWEMIREWMYNEFQRLYWRKQLQNIENSPCNSSWKANCVTISGYLTPAHRHTFSKSGGCCSWVIPGTSNLFIYYIHSLLLVFYNFWKDNKSNLSLSYLLYSLVFF
jgi:hypothetical protein